MKARIIFSIALAVSLQSFSQPRPVRKMPHPLNQPSFSSFAPYISFDGSAIVFLSDYTDDGTLAMQYSKRTGADWSEPVSQTRNFSSKLNFISGFTLSPDGQTLYLTSQLSNGVGGFDIYSCALKGNTFSTPTNLGIPVNSKLHDSAPTITADGSLLYFMRCESMNSQQADRCKLMMSRRQAGGKWGEAQELPSHINTGNSQTPRIMADGETLLFASNKLQPNKGGMDLYHTRWDGQAWSAPVPLDFVNTPQDDQFVSATAQGQYLLRDAKGDRRTELTEFLFPKELKPKAILRIDGKLENAAIPAYVAVIDLNTSKRVYTGRPNADGTFTVFLTEGSRYEIAIDPENANATFTSKYFDLTQGIVRPFERYTTSIKEAAADDEIPLGTISFKPYSSELESTSSNELRRLSRLLKGTPALKAEIQVILQGYVADSIQSDPDLTEMIVDSVEYYLDDIDSLGQLYQRDTLIAEYTFHNDRTQKQAQAVIEQLVALGCDRNGLTYFVNARPEAILEDRKIVVKAVLRKR